MRRELRLLGRGECVVGFGRRGGRSLPTGLRGWSNLAIGLLGAQRRSGTRFLEGKQGPCDYYLLRVYMLGVHLRKMWAAG